MKLSIIIPVYNVEAYLTKCLNSCVNQNVDKADYEIIVVNDGSSDKSSEILEKFNWQDCIHTIITQQNQGLSIARNIGVKKAKGRYIWFVDSDDWIAENSLSVLFPHLNDGYEIICQRVLYNNYPNREIIVKKKGNFNIGSDLLVHPYDPKAQLYIYNRDYFNDLGFMFEPNIYHEDTHFTPRAVYFAKKIKCIEIPLYHYLIRDGSIMSQCNTKKVYDQIKILNDLYEFCNKKVEKKDRRGWIGQLMSGPILNLLWLANKIDDGDVRLNVKKFLNSDSRYSKALIYSPYISIKAVGFVSSLFLGNLYLAYALLLRLKSFCSKLFIFRK